MNEKQPCTNSLHGYSLSKHNFKYNTTYVRATIRPVFTGFTLFWPQKIPPMAGFVLICITVQFFNVRCFSKLLHILVVLITKKITILLYKYIITVSTMPQPKNRNIKVQYPIFRISRNTLSRKFWITWTRWKK